MCFEMLRFGSLLFVITFCLGSVAMVTSPIGKYYLINFNRLVNILHWPFFVIIVCNSCLLNLVYLAVASSKSCRIVEVRSYLKIQCEVNGTMYYRCTHSDIYYQLYIELCDFQVNY